MDQYGRAYQPLYHNICPAGGNPISYYACSSYASDQGRFDHFVISDPSSPPEDIAMINYQASNGHITEHAKFARTIHAQNQNVVQQQMMMHRAQYMQAQQYYALQHQLIMERAEIMKAHYRAQLFNSPAFAEGYALAAPQQQAEAASKAASKASSRKLSKPSSSTRATFGGTVGTGSVYSEVSPSVHEWSGSQHPTFQRNTPAPAPAYQQAPAQQQHAHAPAWRYYDEQPQ